jgi:hypothetical protein
MDQVKINSDKLLKSNSEITSIKETDITDEGKINIREARDFIDVHFDSFCKGIGRVCAISKADFRKDQVMQRPVSAELFFFSMPNYKVQYIIRRFIHEKCGINKVLHIQSVEFSSEKKSLIIKF